MTWYVVSTKHDNLRFKILQFDRTTKIAQLLGDTEVPFTKTLSRDVLEKYGYKIVVEERGEDHGNDSGRDDSVA